MKIYIDITNLSQTQHITGIQRVVKETVERFVKERDFEIILLRYNYTAGIFVHLTENGMGEDIPLSEIECGAVFFDLDNVWSMWLRRSSVIPYLKQRGVKIALCLYDIIPLTHPAYMHENTLINYLDYIGTYLLYADIIVTSTNATLSKVNELTDRMGMERINGYVCPLGADLTDVEIYEAEVDEAVRKAAESGRYILMVGTIEPRKNHKIVLDAFEKELFGKNLHLIWAGNWGWNVEDLKKRVERSPELGHNFFVFQGLSDKEIQYLYQKAYFLVFPSYTEGFGLPIVEAMKNGTPVIASNVDVMREVGGSLCDYFPPDNPFDLCRILNKYMSQEELYRKKKQEIKDYTFLSWDEVGQKMADAVRTLNRKRRLKEPVIRQMVMLSSRPENFLATLPFIENFMTYIKEIVLCCPDGMKGKVEESYRGKLNIRFLTDTEVLVGTPMPEDHTRRNFYLRCMAMKSELLDETFIMSDDDYRPMFPMGEEIFYQKDKYIGYYFYMLGEWKGTTGKQTSFDSSMFRTYDFLKEEKYPCYQFSSHMPQIINRSIYLELLDKYPEIKTQGLDEWSVYFNYMLKYYPEDIEIRPYLSLMWPGNSSDWPMFVRPEKYMFENFYPEHYEKGEIFEGFSTEWKESIWEENLRKIVLYMERQHTADCSDKKYETYQMMYRLEHKEFPAGTVTVGKEIKIYLPEYIVLEKGSCHRLEFTICREKAGSNNNIEESPVMAFRYLMADGLPITESQEVILSKEEGKADIVVWGIRNQGEYQLEFEYRVGDRSGKNCCKAIIIA